MMINYINMNYDGRKDIGINYNLLNLPYQILQNDTVKATFTYIADGTKASAMDSAGNGFDYLGSLVYINNNGNRALESTGFAGGRINKTNNSYDINYFITDHLGSTRVIVDNAGNIKEQKDYYPFGKEHENSSLMSSTNRWGYNGKEKQTVGNLGWLDFSARMYANCEIPIFTTQDPLAEKYYSISPYAYCLNNPVRAVDFDGRLVIFINGMYYPNIKGIIEGPSSGGKAYWEYFSNFNTHVMNHLNDYNAKYIDGSGGISSLLFGTGFGSYHSNIFASQRQTLGEYAGKRDAPGIISQITDENGNIKETIKIITHSMGAAYAKGYVKALVEYLKANNIPLEAIAFEADFAPYQPKSQKAVKGVKTYQFTNYHDNIAGNNPLSPYGYIEGAEVHTYFDENKGHSLSDFWDQIRNLPEGKRLIIFACRNKNIM